MAGAGTSDAAMSNAETRPAFRMLVYYGTWITSLIRSSARRSRARRWRAPAAALAGTPRARVGRGTTAALLLASNAPDVDIVTTAGGALKYLEWHRGLTHGPLGIVGLGIVTAALVWIGRRLYDERWRTPTGRAPDSGRGDAS